MFSEIVKHNRERVELHSLKSFKKILAKNFGVTDIKFEEGNRGVYVGNRFWNWNNLASELGWFDEAEIVTDRNESEKVMTWLNID